MEENKEGPSFCNSPSFHPFKEDGQKLRLAKAGSHTPQWHGTGSDLQVAKISQAVFIYYPWRTEQQVGSVLRPSDHTVSTQPHRCCSTAAETWFSSTQCKVKRPKNIWKLLHVAFLTNAAVFQSSFEQHLKKQSESKHVATCISSQGLFYIYLFLACKSFFTPNYTPIYTFTDMSGPVSAVPTQIKYPPEWELFSNKCGKIVPLVHMCMYPAHTF